MAQTTGNDYSSIGSATDTRRGFWRLIRLPPPEWLPGDTIVALALLGLVAFAVTGFSGDRFSPSWLSGDVFSYPIFLFVWLFILLARLQVLMLRDPLPGSGLIASPLRRGIALGVTGTMVGLIAAFAIITSRFPSVLNQVTNQSGASILHIVVCAVNAWIVCGLVFIGARGAIAWLIRRLRHQAGTGMAHRAAEGFIAASMLFAVLAFLSNLRVLSALANLPLSSSSSHITLDSCVASVFPTCDQHPLPERLQTWTNLDVLLALICIAVGVLILALNALRRGSKSGIMGEEDEIEGVVKDTLAHPFRPLRDLVWFVRHLLWPPFILLAVLGEVRAAVFIQEYLRFLSARHETGQPLLFHLEHYGYLPAALAWAILPVLFMAIAVSLYLWRSPVKSLRQMAWYWSLGFFRLGVVALLPFALISFFLSLCNLIWMLFAPPAPQPFWPPGLSTVVPLALYFIIVALIRLKERLAS